MIGGKGVDIALSATLRFPDDVLAQFDCGLAVQNRSGLEAIGEDGSLYLADPWHGRSPGIVLTARTGSPRRSRSPPPTRTPTSSRTSRAPRAATSRRCWAREDALGQARTIEALYASAESGRSVARSA